jgi:hypothetical protein
MHAYSARNTKLSDLAARSCDFGSLCLVTLVEKISEALTSVNCTQKNQIQNSVPAFVNQTPSFLNLFYLHEGIMLWNKLHQPHKGSKISMKLQMYTVNKSE